MITGGCKSTSVALPPTQWTSGSTCIIQCTSAAMSTAANNMDLDVGSKNDNQESSSMQTIVVGEERLSCNQIENGMMGC